MTDSRSAWPRPTSCPSLPDSTALPFWPFERYRSDGEEILDQLARTLLCALHLQAVYFTASSPQGLRRTELIHLSDAAHASHERWRVGLRALAENKAARELSLEAGRVRVIKWTLQLPGGEGTLLVAADRPAFPLPEEQEILRTTIELAAAAMDRLHHERTFREAIERALPGGIAALDLSGRQAYVNEAFSRMLGWTPEELIGATPPYVYWPPEELDNIQRAFERTLRGEAPSDGFELRLRRRDGQRFWAQALVTRLTDEGGHLRGWLASVVDISHRKRAANALEESEARMQAVLDNTAACIFIKDLQGRYTLANRRFLELLGRRADQVLGHTDYELHSPEMAASYVENDRRVLERGEPLEFEEDLDQGDERRTYLLLKFPLRDPEGAVYGICGIATDIHSRKRTEAELAKFKFLTDRSVEAHALLDRDGRFVYVNQTHCRLHGYSADQLLGMCVTGIDATMDLEAYRRLFDSVQRATVPPLETIHRRQDGREFPVEIALTGVQFDGVPYVFAATRDISERKQSEQALRDSERRFRTYLNAIRDAVFVYPLHEDGTPGQFVEVNEEACRRLGYRRDELLKYSVREIAAFPSRSSGPQQAIAQLLEQGELIQQAAHRTRDGHLIPVEVSARLVLLDGKQHVISIARDISQRQHTEQQLRRQNERLQLLSESAGLLLSATDPARMIDELFARVANHLNLDVYANYRLDEDEQCLILEACGGVSEEARAALQRVPLGEALCGKVAERRAPVVVSDLQQSSDASHQPAREMGLTVYAGFPLLAGGQLLGTLAFASRRRDRFDADELEFLQTICHYVATAKQRVRVEQALRYQLQLNQSITDNASAALFMINERGYCKFMNPAAERMTGFTFEEITQEPLHNLIHHRYPDGRPFPIEECPIVRALPDRLELRNHEDVFVRRSGEMFPVRCAARPVIEDARLIGTMIEVQDVTEQKRADALQDRQKQVLELIASEAPLDQILRLLCRILEEQTSADSIASIMLVDAEGLRLRHGAAPSLPASFCEAMNGLRIDPETGGCGVAAALNEVVISSEIATDPKWAAYRKQALQIGLKACWSMPIRSSAGHVLGVFSSYSRHCRIPTSREYRLVEMLARTASIAIERKNSEERLRRSERLYRGIGESINFGVWVCDPSGSNVYMSASFLELVGMSQQQCAGLGWLRALDPEDVDAIRAAWLECIRDGSFWEREYRVRGADNQWYNVLSRGVPIRGDDGAVLCWAGIHLDIGRLKRTEEALKEADRRKDEFLATLAHELRNPLAPIRNAVDLLQLVGNDPQQIEALREVMQRQVQQMVRLIDDLLDVSRISRGKIELRKARIELSSVITAALEAIRPLFQDQCQLIVEQAAEPLVINGDMARLTQVVTNLLNNAAKYTARGGRVRLVTGREGHHAVVRVQDTGVGIPPDKLNYIFELFAQVDRSLSSSQSGLGIGLTLVKSLVEMHGGSITAHSEGEGQGSEFVVRLPLQPSQQPTTDTPLLHVGSVTAGHYRILVVEDSQPVADVFAMLLRSLGHDVQVARSGSEALEQVQSQLPDVVFSDISMPGMSGYELARQLRRLFPSVYMVAVTGYGQIEDRQRALQEGFDQHLVKPAALEDLQAVLQSLGARGRASRMR